MTLLRALLPRETKSAPVPVQSDMTWLYERLVSSLSTVALSGDYSASYDAMWKAQPWVRIVVNKLVWGVARLPLKVYQRDAAQPQKRQRAYGGPLVDLLKTPNDSKDTGSAMLYKGKVLRHLCVYGNCIVIKEQTAPDEPPTALWPYSPLGWSMDEDGSYLYRPSGWSNEPPKRFQPWRIMHYMEPGGPDGVFGVSRLEALRRTLAIEDAAQRLIIASYGNGARPSGIVSVKGELSEAAAKRMKADIMRLFGGVDNAFLPAVLEGDSDWKPLSFNMTDQEVTAHRQLTREEVCAAYDIPPTMVGILDHATFSNIEHQHIHLYQDSIGPWLTLYEETTQAQLINGVPAFGSQFVEFDLNEVLKGDTPTRMTAYATAINASIMTPEEARERENLPPMTDKQPEAGRLRFPLNTTTGVAAEQPTGGTP